MARDKELNGKLLLLARSLLEGTRSGNVTWSTIGGENKFLCAGTRSSVTIETLADRDGTVTILSILNNRGTVVDSIESEFSTSADPWNDTSAVPSVHNEILDDLYHAARRAAYNVDDAIDSLLEDIQGGVAGDSDTNGSTGSEGPQAKDKDPWAEDNNGYSDEPPF